MFQDYLTTAVADDEVLTTVSVPSYDGYGHAYLKFTRRAEDWAMVGVAALVKVSGGTFEDVRIGLTHMGTTPLRATAVEQALTGQSGGRGDDRVRGRGGGRGHRPARRPERHAGLQAPPGARAGAACRGAGSRGLVSETWRRAAVPALPT